MNQKSLRGVVPNLHYYEDEHFSKYPQNNKSVDEFKSKLGFKWSSLNLAAGDYKGLEVWLANNLNSSSWSTGPGSWTLLKSVTDVFLEGTCTTDYVVIKTTDGVDLALHDTSRYATSREDYFNSIQFLKREIPKEVPGKVTNTGILDHSIPNRNK